jgi:tryptophanyl-tRNA synthetase
MKERIFSGIQPSGVIHIGNYLGAIKNWITLLDQYDCIFCIVDYHAITVSYDAEDLKTRTLEGVKTLITAGIDPEKCTLFIQSRVPEHTELTWILNTVTPVSDLERMTQYKDKKQQNVDNINTGLLTYPILMASDILLYKTNAVPVGEDQVQHLELTREIARRFNTRYGETFPEPRTIIGDAPRIKGIDGNAKMSKSMNNYIALLEDEDELWGKLRIAVTDPARKRRNDPGNPWICNMFTLHRSFSSKDEITQVEQGCRTAGIGCIDCKKILHNNMNAFMEPLRNRKRELDADPGFVADVLEEGRKNCSARARSTMEEVRRKIGVTV